MRKSITFSIILNHIRFSHLGFFLICLKELRAIKLLKSDYSQTGEEAVLRQLLPYESGFYIDIGSGRPVTSSNTYYFNKAGWDGICVDPITRNIKLTKLFRPSKQAIQCVVSNQKEFINFWEFDPYEFSTADDNVAAQLIYRPDIQLKKVSRVKSIPLSDLIEKIPVDMPTLLSVDAEGFDLEVLESNDWVQFRPTVICIEDWDTKSGPKVKTLIEVYLTSLNYCKRANTELSSIYVDNESMFVTTEP
jgi:FkbM family methyltransferase